MDSQREQRLIYCLVELDSLLVFYSVRVLFSSFIRYLVSLFEAFLKIIGNFHEIEVRIGSSICFCLLAACQRTIKSEYSPIDNAVNE